MEWKGAESSLDDAIEGVQDGMKSPDDLPPLEFVTSHLQGKKEEIDISQKRILGSLQEEPSPRQSIRINKQEKPRSLTFTSTSPLKKRKDSTPEFEEAERQLMLESQMEREKREENSIFQQKKENIVEPNEGNDFADIFEKEAALLAQKFSVVQNLATSSESSEMTKDTSINSELSFTTAMWQ